MAETSGSHRRRLFDAAEKTVVGLNPLRRKWLLKLTAALIARDDPAATIPWGPKLRAARDGFLPASYVLYDLSTNGHRDYISDFERETRTRGQSFSRALNGQAWPLLRDKLAFHFLCEEVGIPTPEVFAVIKQGRPHWVGDRSGPGAWTELRSLIDEQACVVVKPVDGSFGEGVLFVESSPGGYRVNGEARDWTSVEQGLRTLEYVLVSERVKPAAYSASIFPRTTNVLGLLTVRRTGRKEAHLVTAIQRFGRLCSLPVDNFGRDSGGLSAAIDTSAGILGRAAYLGQSGELEWHSRHPDTGAAIEGVHIPQWDRIRDRVLEASDALPFLPYVRWDVVATESGCTILEGNDSPGLQSLQVHGPLLADAEVRRFFEEHGVIRPPGRGFLVRTMARARGR